MKNASPEAPAGDDDDGARIAEGMSLIYTDDQQHIVQARARHVESLRVLHADVKPDNLCLTYGEPDDVGTGKPVDAIAAAGYRVTLIDYSLAVDLRGRSAPLAAKAIAAPHEAT